MNINISMSTPKEDIESARIALKACIAQSKDSKYTKEQQKIILKNIKINTREIIRLSKLIK